MHCNSVFPSSGPIPAPAQEIAARFCTENVNSPDYEKIRELETFNFYDQLWIRRTMDARDKGKTNIPNCYEITSRAGHPIFRVVQILDNLQEYRPSSPDSKPPFKFSIFDMRSGNEVIKLVAKQGADSVVVSTKQKHMEYHGIGKILRVRSGNMIRCPDYNVRGASGKLIMKVNGGYSFMYKKAGFDITTADSSQIYGKIHKYTEDDQNSSSSLSSSLDHPNSDAIFKLQFPIDISMVSKALIVATALVADYDYFDSGSKEVKTDFLLMSIGLAFVTLIVLMAVIIISVSITSRFGTAGGGFNATNNRNDLDHQYELIEPNQRKIHIK